MTHLAGHGTVVPGSTYWNLGFGLDKGDVKKDAEALRNVQDLGETIAWLGEAIQRHPLVPTEFKDPKRGA